MNRNYRVVDYPPAKLGLWSTSRNTHIAVASAIHAIADDRRSAEAIWDSPTQAEWDHVRMAVNEYIEHGDFPAEPDNRYFWGNEIVTL